MPPPSIQCTPPRTHRRTKQTNRPRSDRPRLTVLLQACDVIAVNHTTNSCSWVLKSDPILYELRKQRETINNVVLCDGIELLRHLSVKSVTRTKWVCVRQWASWWYKLTDYWIIKDKCIKVKTEWNSVVLVNRSSREGTTIEDITVLPKIKSLLPFIYP